MPTKVYEYMASGLPTLVTGRGEVAHFVSESGGGVHAANAPVESAERLAALLDDEERRQRLGANGREHVVASYDRAAIAARLAEEIEWLIEWDETA